MCRTDGRRTVASAVGAIAMLFFMAVPAAQAQDRVSGGINVRVVSGTFGGDQTTTITYAPAVLRVDMGRFELAGFFPYVSISDAAGSLSGGGWIPAQGSISGQPNVGMTMTGTSGSGMMGNGGMMGGTTGQSTVTTTGTGNRLHSAGFGDVVGSVGYRIMDNLLTGVQLVATARVKVPTASASQGLGTGRADVGSTLAIRKRFDSGWVFSEVGYLVVGQPAGTTLRNAFTWSVGGGKQIASRTFLLLSGVGNSSALPGYQAPAEVGAGVGFRLADHLNLTVVPSVGLTHASPSYGVTMGLSSELWRR